MSYLRQFRKLRSVSFKGNPCCDEPNAYPFVRAALHRITYLDYKIITEEEREAGKSLFRYETNENIWTIFSIVVIVSTCLKDP